MACFFSLPLTRADGTKLTFDEVIKQLDNDTVHYNAGIGGRQTLSEDLQVSIQVEKSKYPLAIRWLSDSIWGSEFAIDRYFLMMSFRYT